MHQRYTIFSSQGYLCQSAHNNTQSIKPFDAAFSLGEPVVVTEAAVVDAGERVGGGAYVLR